MRPSADPLWQAVPLLRPRWPRLALAVALGVLSLGSALALAAVSAWLITRAWQMPPILDLSVAVVAVRAFGISRGVLHYCERLASHDTALRAADSARRQIYSRLAEGPADTTARLPSGELAGRVGADVDEFADALVRAVLPIAVAAVLSAAAVAVIAVISPAAGLILAGCLAVAGLLAPWLSARAATAQEQVARDRQTDRDVAALELQVSGRLPGLIEEAAEQQRSWGRAIDAAATPAAFGAAVPTAAVGAAVLGCALVGIAIAPSVAPTTLAILMLLPLSSFEATVSLPAAAIQLTRSRIAARRLLDLLGPPAQPTEPIAAAPADHTLRADGAGIELHGGDRLAVTGPSGCGKTTLLMTLAGLLASGGQPITIGGIPIRDLGDDEMRRAVIFFAEDAHVFDTTVRDNLLVVRGDACDDELHAALRKVGLDDWLHALPDGLATVLVGGAAALSAGQRRRLLLARALLATAPVVLLDEPTEHLDADDARLILHQLLGGDGLFAADRTVVVATHQPLDDIGCQHLNLAVTG
jgi:ATP-binding cassette, subfamily C, bacterial CydC